MSGTVEQWSPSIGEWYETHVHGEKRVFNDEGEILVFW